MLSQFFEKRYVFCRMKNVRSVDHKRWIDKYQLFYASVLAPVNGELRCSTRKSET